MLVHLGLAAIYFFKVVGARAAARVVAQTACGPGASRPFQISTATATTSITTESGCRILAALDKHAIKSVFLALDKAIVDHYPFLIK